MLKKVYIAAAAAAMIYAAPAQAADYFAPETAVAPTWTGFYLGAGAGVAWADYDAGGSYCDPYGVCASGNFIDNLVGNLDNDANFRGLVQAGLDWEIIPGFLVGVRGDYNFGQDIGFGTSGNYVEDTYNLTDAASFNIQDMWTVAGRFGWATEETLFYGLAGWTWANSDLSFKHGCIDGGCDVDFSNDETIDGWTVGAGVEFRGWFAENASTTLEYRYTDLSDKSISGYDDLGYFYKLDTAQNVQGVYLTVNWRFNGL